MNRIRLSSHVYNPRLPRLLPRLPPSTLPTPNLSHTTLGPAARWTERESGRFIPGDLHHLAPRPTLQRLFPHSKLAKGLETLPRVAWDLPRAFLRAQINPSHPSRSSKELWGCSFQSTGERKGKVWSVGLEGAKLFGRGRGVWVGFEGLKLGRGAGMEGIKEVGGGRAKGAIKDMERREEFELYFGRQEGGMEEGGGNRGRTSLSSSPSSSVPESTLDLAHESTEHDLIIQRFYLPTPSTSYPHNISFEAPSPLSSLWSSSLHPTPVPEDHWDEMMQREEVVRKTEVRSFLEDLEGLERDWSLNSPRTST